MENKYQTIQEYLSKLLYPTVNKALEDLLSFIREDEFYDRLSKEFNQNYYENKKEKLLKDKELLRLERGSDYSETDYDYFMRMHGEVMMNESKSFSSAKSEVVNPEPAVVEDFDPDFDNTQGLSIDGDGSEEEVILEKFNPIEFLVAKLREYNLNKIDNVIKIDEITNEDDYSDKDFY
jgi:hypothetical protein